VKNPKTLAIVGAVALSLVAGSFPAPAQTTPPPEFEVATVKAVEPPRPGEQNAINLGTIQNGRVTLTNTTLSDCIKFAYGIVSDDQISGPDWIKSREARFEIVAQAPAGTPQDKLLLMLQALLADRLKLVLHREQKPMSFMALGVAKNGPKLKPPKDASSPSTLGLGRIVHPRMSMPVLANLLSRFERMIVVDLTEISGVFDVNLEWLPEFLRSKVSPDGGPVSLNGQVIDGSLPSLVTALQEQLGLRLESRRGPLNVLVVDRAEKVPTAN
jgi:uncharacterized protein (TIGR03435 family)